jgi:hypothetical protein
MNSRAIMLKSREDVSMWICKQLYFHQKLTQVADKITDSSTLYLRNLPTVETSIGSRANASVSSDKKAV